MNVINSSALNLKALSQSMADTVFAGLIVYAQTFPAKNEMWASEATSVVRKETWSLINFAPQNTIVEDIILEKLSSVDP